MSDCCCNQQNRVFTGEVTVAKNESGAGGNLTVENKIFAKSIEVDNIVVSSGNAVFADFTITGDGATSAFTLTHSMDSQKLVIQVYDNSGELIAVDTKITSNNAIVLTFGTAPTAGTSYSVRIVKYVAPTIEEEEDAA